MDNEKIMFLFSCGVAIALSVLGGLYIVYDYWKSEREDHKRYMDRHMKNTEPESLTDRYEKTEIKIKLTGKFHPQPGKGNSKVETGNVVREPKMICSHCGREYEGKKVCGGCGASRWKNDVPINMKIENQKSSSPQLDWGDISKVLKVIADIATALSKINGR